MNLQKPLLEIDVCGDCTRRIPDETNGYVKKMQRSLKNTHIGKFLVALVGDVADLFAE